MIYTTGMRRANVEAEKLLRQRFSIHYQVVLLDFIFFLSDILRKWYLHEKVQNTNSS